MSAAPILVARGLTKRFGGLVAVHGLEPSIGPGEIVGLLGPNGSGKTTALNMISGALTPSAGSLALDGAPIGGMTPHRIARRGIARTFQLVRILPSLTCEENVLAGLVFGPGAPRRDKARAAAAVLLERAGLGDVAGRPAAQLTYIDQKRLELARALALRPRLLLLDEWLAGLNPTELVLGIALIGALRGEGLAILMVEHVMLAIRSLCDRVVVMNAGAKIAEGPPATALAEPAVVRAYLGEP